MVLPKKDKNGKQYLSYSAISLFKRDIDEFYKRYILCEPFLGNAYTDFGSKVGEALEKNDFSQFDNNEEKILKQVTRLDEFEKKVELHYEDFYVMGFIDTNKFNYSHIIDYKTGGRDKEHQYKHEDYTQLVYYALALRQTFGVTPKVGEVHFLRRSGNAYMGDTLTLANEPPTVISTDLSYARLKKVYFDTIEVANQISKFYQDNAIQSN